MFFIQRLFAVYYLFLVRLRRNKIFRHLNRGGTEDFGAMCFVLCSLFYLLILILYFLKVAIGFQILVLTQNPLLSKVIIITILGLILFMSYKYFISNRARRNKFIDSFNELSSRNKLIWKVFGIFLMLSPVWFLIYLFFNR